MGGSSMPKADYDLMAIMYSAYGIHHILCNIDGNRFQLTRDLTLDAWYDILQEPVSIDKLVLTIQKCKNNKAVDDGGCRVQCYECGDDEL